MTVKEHLKRIERLMRFFENNPRVMSQLRKDWFEAQKLADIEKRLFPKNPKGK